MTWSLGVDFGTSNTAAAYRVDGSPAQPVRLSDQAEQMPSAILALDSGILVGGAAVRSARLDPQRFEPSPKRRLGEGEILLGAREWPVIRLIAEVLTHVKQKAMWVAGGQPPHELILTYPQQWAGGRKELLRQAAVLAGFDPATVRLVTEPIAAATWYASTQPVPPGKCVAVFDFGGGTCDVAVLQANRDDPGTFSVLAADGVDPLGGELLDLRLLEWTLGQLAAGGNKAMVDALSAPENLGALLTLKEQVRHAKHELAEYESARIPVAVGSIQTVVTITGAEFDKVVGGEIDEAVKLTRRALIASGVAPADLHALYLTGGSSHLRLVHRRMTELLGRPPATLNDPKLVVAQGALLAPPAALEAISPAVGTGPLPTGPLPTGPTLTGPVPTGPVASRTPAPGTGPLPTQPSQSSRPAAPPPQTGGPGSPPTGPSPAPGSSPMPTGPLSTGPMPTGPMPTGPMSTGPMSTGPTQRGQLPGGQTPRNSGANQVSTGPTGSFGSFGTPSGAPGGPQYRTSGPGPQAAPTPQAPSPGAGPLPGNPPSIPGRPPVGQPLPPGQGPGMPPRPGGAESSGRPPAGRGTPKWLIPVAAAVVVAIVATVVILLTNRNDDAGPGGDTVTTSSTTSQAPTDTSTSPSVDTSPAQNPGQICQNGETIPADDTCSADPPTTCWDDSQVAAGEVCPALTGQQALEWIYPVEVVWERTCAPYDDPVAGEEEVYRCTVTQMPDTVFYLSRWESVDVASEQLTTEAGKDPTDWSLEDDDKPSGRQWEYSGTNDDGVPYNARVVLYDDSPFSIYCFFFDDNGKAAQEEEDWVQNQFFRNPEAIATQGSLP